METTRKLSLYPACSACPEVEILQHKGQPIVVRIGEDDEKITLPKEAWNTLVRYVREGALKEL